MDEKKGPDNLVPLSVLRGDDDNIIDVDESDVTEDAGSKVAYATSDSSACVDLEKNHDEGERAPSKFANLQARAKRAIEAAKVWKQQPASKKDNYNETRRCVCV